MHSVLYRAGTTVRLYSTNLRSFKRASDLQQNWRCLLVSCACTQRSHFPPKCFYVQGSHWQGEPQGTG